MAKLWNLYSWNVNGVRAIHKKGFCEWFYAEKPDVLGLQETKIQGHQLIPELTHLDGYNSYWSHAQEKKGYSGTAIFTNTTPESVTEGLGNEAYDKEGRVLQADFGPFVYMTIYYPNGKQNQDRLDYKMGFYDAFLETANKIVASGKGVVACGDFNTAHNEIDLARPKENQKVSGFLPIEREWMSKFVDNGYTDTFRHFHPELTEQYTWWDQVTRARERNVGWRIDYFFISNNLLPNLKSAAIHPQVMGSDHCPVSIQLEI